MKLGLISDIHADHDALERALELLDRRGAQKVVCMGDMVENGTAGDRVIETLTRHLIPCVRGNHDDNAIRRFYDRDHDEDDPLLDADTVSSIEAMPVERSYVWEGTRVSIAHIAPAGIDEPVLPDHTPRRLKRTLRNYEIDLLLLGHTHRPMKVRHGELWIVNLGSVAGTRTRDSATCAIVELPTLEVQVFSIETGEPTSYALVNRAE